MLWEIIKALLISAPGLIILLVILKATPHRLNTFHWISLSLALSIIVGAILWGKEVIVNGTGRPTLFHMLITFVVVAVYNYDYMIIVHTMTKLTDVNDDDRFNIPD